MIPSEFFMFIPHVLLVLLILYFTSGKNISSTNKLILYGSSVYAGQYIDKKQDKCNLCCHYPRQLPKDDPTYCDMYDKYAITECGDKCQETTKCLTDCFKTRQHHLGEPLSKETLSYCRDIECG